MNAKLEALNEMVKEQTKMVQAFSDFLTQGEAEWTQSNIDASNEDDGVADSGDVAWCVCCVILSRCCGNNVSRCWGYRSLSF